jgi:hypothetical protein
MIALDLTATIGSTPLVELGRLALESQEVGLPNPARYAFGMPPSGLGATRAWSGPNVSKRCEVLARPSGAGTHAVPVLSEGSGVVVKSYETRMTREEL